MGQLIRLMVLALLIAGCATATPTQKGAVTGSAIGAGLGAIIGHQSGDTAEGALVGAAAGGLAGALIGDAMANQFCATCGRKYLPSDGVACPVDGTALRPIGAPARTVEEQKKEETLAYFCSECGYRAAEAGFCPEDGTKLKARQS